MSMQAARNSPLSNSMVLYRETDHYPTTKSSVFSCRPTIWYKQYMKRKGNPKPPKPDPQTRTFFNFTEQLRPLSTRAPQLPSTDHDPFSNRPARASEQPQSSFCSRLPREIRLEIFRYVLGGRYFHLRYGDGKIRPYICRYPCVQRSPSVVGSDGVDGHSHARCWDQYYPSWQKHQLSMALSSNMLPLLQTCSRL